MKNPHIQTNTSHGCNGGFETDVMNRMVEVGVSLEKYVAYEQKVKLIFSLIYLINNFEIYIFHYFRKINAKVIQYL